MIIMVSPTFADILLCKAECHSVVQEIAEFCIL
jgi:hypothetical protein